MPFHIGKCGQSPRHRPPLVLGDDGGLLGYPGIQPVQQIGGHFTRLEIAWNWRA